MAQTWGFTKEVGDLGEAPFLTGATCPSASLCWPGSAFLGAKITKSALGSFPFKFHSNKNETPIKELLKDVFPKIISRCACENSNQKQKI